MINEQKALQVGESKSLLMKRFKWSLSVMSPSMRPHFPRTFDPKRIDMERKTYQGFAGYYLQWKLRPQPDLPESYDNQQTNQGCVMLEHIDDN